MAKKILEKDLEKLLGQLSTDEGRQQVIRCLAERDIGDLKNYLKSAVEYSDGEVEDLLEDLEMAKAYARDVGLTEEFRESYLKELNLRLAEYNKLADVMIILSDAMAARLTDKYEKTQDLYSKLVEALREEGDFEKAATLAKVLAGVQD